MPTSNPLKREARESAVGLSFAQKMPSIVKKALGLANEPHTNHQIWKHIIGIAMTYHGRMNYVKVTPSKLMAEIKPLSQLAIRLSKRIGALDPHSRDLLTSLGWTVSDEKAVCHAQDVLMKAVIAVGGTTRARANWPLGMAVTDLFYTFTNQHRSPYKGWEKFVSTALTEVGIEHDDTHPHRLIDVLPDAIRKDVMALRSHRSTRSHP